MIVFENIANQKLPSEDEIVDDILTFIAAIKIYNRETIKEKIMSSKLVGRGGSSTLISTKWNHFLQFESPKYLIVNAYEGEPFCEKDKALLRYETARIFTGIYLIAHTLEISEVFLAINQKYENEIELVAKIAKKLGKKLPKITIHKTSERYIAGEETALINDIEGNPPRPYQRPPYPTENGIFNRPTLVHNLETVAMLPAFIINKDFIEVGTEQSIGTKLFCVSGDMPGVFIGEFPFGTSLKKVLTDAGFSATLYAVMFGIDAPLNRSQSENLVLSIENLRAVNAHLGTGNIRVFSSEESLFKHLFFLMDFLEKESCAQCCPCRLGSKILPMALRKFYETKTVEDEILFYAKQMYKATKCSFAAAMANCFLGAVANFGRNS